MIIITSCAGCAQAGGRGGPEPGAAQLLEHPPAGVWPRYLVATGDLLVGDGVCVVVGVVDGAVRWCRGWLWVAEVRMLIIG